MDTYEDIYNAVFHNPYYGRSWKRPGGLPVYKQTLATLLDGLLPGGKRFGFLEAARRTVKSRADLRWGKDRTGFRRLLHPMGICLAGTWRIDAAPPGSPYTGYFAKGVEGRIIGRYSTGGSNPCGGHYRSLALVGKIYPPEGSSNDGGVPANFFTQEDLGTNFTNSIRDGILTNSPPVSPWKRGKDIFQLFWIGLILTFADKRNSERQLYEIAELGKPADERTRCPRFMRLTVSDETPHSYGRGVDFRDEILGILYNRGEPFPSGRRLVFDIAVSDQGKKHGIGIEWLTGQHWTRIGSITFTEAVASYNGDFVIHFHHPPWRNDRNDPRSVARRELRSTGAKS
jgi:hypothetical protein